jgi:hypothetical protein
MSAGTSTNSQFFDINSDEAFFHSLERAALKFRLPKIKDTANVLYLLMGVNHLRDWICHGFNAKEQAPATPEQHFYVAIYDLPEFKIVNSLCNRSKHMGRMPYQLEARYGAMVSEYPDIGSLFSFENGPPLGYFVDGRDLIEIINVVLRFYRSEWYEKSRS